MKRTSLILWVCACLAAVACVSGLLYANGGPFVVKYPGGDPAAKGVLARLEPDLKPGREERLKVVKEDLKVVFPTDTGLQWPAGTKPPLPEPPRVRVTAAYTIENPTDSNVEMDFGFPILRGVYLNRGMAPYPDVRVKVAGSGSTDRGVYLDRGLGPSPDVPVKFTGSGSTDRLVNLNVGMGRPPDVLFKVTGSGSTDGFEYVSPQIITNSVIYGIIRQNARELIDKAVAADAELAKQAAAIKAVLPVEQRAASAPAKALVAYLKGTLKWNERDAALMVEYAILGDLMGKMVYPKDRNPMWWSGGSAKLVEGSMGPLSAIGEQKATQFFAQLANCFDPKAGAAYEAIFTAWGGDVKENSVDLKTGKVRPREIAVDANQLAGTAAGGYPDAYAPYDPTVYARVDYLDEKAQITAGEKASCRNILKNLPVVFTFAPMNLIYYRVTFPPKSTRVLSVEYSQYAYKDTGGPASYQLAYVVHPASLWKDFGPINLEVSVPPGLPFRASVDCPKGERAAAPPSIPAPAPGSVQPDVYRGLLTEKTGEIFLAVDAAAWDKLAAAATPASTPNPPLPAKQTQQKPASPAKAGVAAANGGAVQQDPRARKGWD